MNMKKKMKKGLALLLTLVMVIGMAPNIIVPTTAATANPAVVVDPGTAANWEGIMGTSADGSRYAGRVWVDKSVYKHGDTVILNRENNAQSTFPVVLDQANGEYFQVVFSALGSSMSTNTTVSGSRPLDVVLILDNSSSMNTYASGRTTRMEYLVNAANNMLEQLMDSDDVRLGIVAYSQNASTVLPFGTYNNGVQLGVNSYTGSSSSSGIIRAYDSDGDAINSNYRSNGYANYTNTQAGIEMGMGMLAAATDTANRKPIVIVLTDGAANTAKDRMFVSGANGTVRQVYHSNNIDPMIALSTLLGAAYSKAQVQKHYGRAPEVYGIGVDLSASDGSNAIINPAESFNSSNTNANIRSAYSTYTTDWQRGSNVNINSGNYNFRFEHSYPQGSGITDSDITANINYIDTYYPVTGANLGEAFEDIYQQLISEAFNPITSSTSGATGVQDTPLIYVDNIGKYMQIKDIQALQVFGKTYEVTKNNDGSYSVAAGTGTNPTTNESWSTTEDFRIEVRTEADGTQQLRVYINQEILPILLDKITVTTENGVTTRTLETIEYPPLRLYYTVGIDGSVLLPNGQVDMTKIDSGYAYTDTANGTVSFYSNAFGEMNIADRDNDGLIDLGDAHVGFVPSHSNRFYYHQTHQEVFISATKANGDPIEWEAGEYGVRWDPDLYSLEALSYDDYNDLEDDTQVYTYVTFSRPTGSGNAAEEVTYLVYTTWGALKESVTLYDKVNSIALNGGSAIAWSQVGSTVSAYKQGKTVTDGDLIAVLGLQSRRVSRLNNMFEYKAEGQNYTGSAELAYAPAYNEGAHTQDDIHEHSEVIVWLGNNGKLTLPIGTGLQVTKTVTELANGAAANEKFPISVLLDMEYSAAAVAGLTFVDGQGNALGSSDYTVTNSNSKILVTFNLANGESAYILGLTGGVAYTVTEAQNENYTYTYTGATRTVAGRITEGVVTNRPIQPGTLYITKEVVPYKAGEPFPTDYEFEFKVTFVDKNGNPIANTPFRLVNDHEPSLTERSTDANGVMTGDLCHGETVQIFGIPAGATVTVAEVNIPELYTASYLSRDHSHLAEDTDGVVTIFPEENATVVVTNTYRPKSTSAKLDLTIQKTLLVDNPVTEGSRSFDFNVEKWNGTAWQLLKEVNIDFQSNEIQTGEPGNVKAYNAPNDPINLGTFTEAGTYIYQIYEVIPAVRVPGMAYDRAIHTITVTVADVNGQLQVTAVNETGASVEDTDRDGDLDFTAAFRNEENSVAVSIDIIKHVNDTSKNPEISKAGFEFVAQQATVEGGNWSVVTGGRTLSVYSDGIGDARMTATYKQAGTYYYIVSETPNGSAGWTNSTAKYYVTVTVDGTNDLAATMTITRSEDNTETEIATVTENTKGKIVFENKYDPTDAKLPLGTLVEKALTGRALQAGEFKFAIFENHAALFDANNMLTNIGDAIAVGANDAAGKVAFTSGKNDETKGITFKDGELYFAQLGMYEYDIVEVKGTLGGMTYDSIIYDLVVEVSDVDRDGVLEINYYFEDQVGKTVTFRNVYTVSETSVVIDGLKTLQVQSGSKSLREGDYTFYLYDAAGTRIGETTNAANGTFQFAPITYTGANIGTHTYKVKEKDAGTTVNGVTHSGAEFTVTVEVTDNGDGTLSTVVTGNGRESINFVNIYNTNPVAVNLPATKKLTGKDLAAEQFKFALYRTNLNFENRELIDDTVTHNERGEINLHLGTYGVGTYYFVVMEVIPETRAPGVHYDLSEYRIIVDVTDGGLGQTSYTYAVMKDGNTSQSIAFSNIYSPENQQLVISGTKTYEGGKALTDGMFQIGLYSAAGELLHTANVKADGSFTFDPVTYSYADVGGTFTYTVKEIIPAGATDNGDGTYTSGSNIYDGTAYTVTVTVADNNGVLQITKTSDALNFTNTYINPTPVSYTPEAKKIYNKVLAGGEFTFALEGEINGQKVDQKKTNDAQGKVTFDAIQFPKAGIYTFKVKEVNKILGFIEYSTAEYELVVKIVDTEGTLSIDSVTVNGDPNGTLEFINTYKLADQGEVILRGTKVLTGDRTAVKEGEFTFGLYSADGTLVEAVKNSANGEFVFTALKFSEKDVPVNGSTTRTYTVKEIAGSDWQVTYDETVYTVVITAEDDGEGGIKVAYTIDGKADGKLVFTNIYKETENPKTGEDTPILLVMGSLMAVSGAALILLLTTKKQKGGKYLARC